MISRRQIRIKTFQTLYAYYKNEGSDLKKSEKELLFNINKSYDLYISIFILLIEIVNYAESRIDLARKKLKPLPEDINPNMRFINSELIRQIRHSEQLTRYVDAKKITWVNYPELIKELLIQITADEYYKKFMDSENFTYSDEVKLFTHILTNIIYPSEEFEQVLEEQSIYWNDDLEYMISMAIKTLKKFKDKDSRGDQLLPLFKDDGERKVPEDKEFALNLLRKSVVNKGEYTEYIKKNTKNWDLDRIAFADILIMQLAIAEFTAFPSIPVKVTLNEYLEISKLYSTSKSSVFINGVLDKVVMQLREKKLIKKTGRGLIGEFDSPKEN